MFGKKSLRKRVDEIESNHRLLTECETCRCEIRRHRAVEGKPEVRRHGWPYDAQMYVHVPYYCHRCAADMKKPKKKRSMPSLHSRNFRTAYPRSSPKSYRYP